MPAAVAARYARALADLVMLPGAGITPEEAVRQLETFGRALAESAPLRQVLLSPAVPAPEKRAIVQKLSLRLGLADLVKRFLLVIIDRRRTALLAQVRESFEEVVNERLGRVRVDVTSARELSEPQRQALAAGLARLTGKQPQPRFLVDPELIGGVVARVGSTVYDGSIRGQLEALKRRLAGAET